ncbi:VCBS repeat-containing protein, partial [Streptomyces sp. SCA3-4]|uniref:FG-GAP repeat domain-containing protein n=1 Tax=Streptomyces sichuanensis TaxID=2871810 RepID=UPI001CE2DF44
QTGTALHETDDTFATATADWDRDGRPDLVAVKKSRTGTNSTEVHILSGAGNFQRFVLQTGTALHETDGTFAFTLADWDRDGRPDLVAVKKSRTGTNSTEVHILSGASNFQRFALQTGTALHETDDTFDYAATDWDRDGRPDLVAIKKSRTGTNSTEVHILSGASNFQRFALQTGTALHETDDTFDYAATDWDRDGRPDLVAIKKSRTGTNSTEVHILSGASNFQRFVLQTGTALHETDDTFEFSVADWNRDGRPDLVAVKKSRTGTNSTEVHILSGASNFQRFALQTGTALHETDDTFDYAATDWDRDGRPDLVAIKKSRTGTNSTEVHILSGASNFQRFVLQTGTALHETDDTFEFSVADWNRDGRPDLVAVKKSRTGTNSTEVHILG